MKKLIIILSILGLFSCEDVLDKKELKKIDEKDVWGSADRVNLYLNDLYRRCLPGFAGNSNTDLSGEAPGDGVDEMMYGGLKFSSSFGSYGNIVFTNIRLINIMLEDIETSTFDQDEIDLIKAQTYFLRAWTFWKLVYEYGGVPIVNEVYTPAEGLVQVLKRNSARECIDALVSDLDIAIEDLPDTWPESDRGRLTRGAAAALKGRILLFYASPQFNPDNLRDRWQTAYDANKYAKDLCEGDGYQLYNNYEKIFLDEEKTNEAIFLTVYDNVLKHHAYENAVRPGIESAENSSSSNPTWEFVASYPMLDGFKPGESPTYTYDKEAYWIDRDPRFYSTIAYNGCLWELSGQAGRKQWNYVGSISEQTSQTKTGFYLRKNVDESIDAVNTRMTPTDWIEIRLAEVYLNLAECAAELGLVDEARAELISIRKRAGIEDGNGSYGITATTGPEMVDAVIFERQIELAFENKRYLDLRRRNLYASTLNGTRRTGIYTTVVMPDSIFDDDITIGDSADSRNLYLQFFNDSVVADIDLDTEYDTYFEIEYDVEMDLQDINFLQPKYNFYFLPQSALDKNLNLQQTIYWGEIDPFDPLAD